MKLTKKSVLVVVLIMTICVGLVAFFNSSSAANVNTANSDLSKFVQLQKDEISLEKELGSNTPYPRLYMMAEALVELRGASTEEAITQATNRYIEKAALVWYAENNGICVTDAEFEAHLNSLIEAAKGADNYEELNAVYKRSGSSLEEMYRKNSDYYRDDYIIGKLCDQWNSEFTQEKRLSESEMESADSAWEKFVAETVTKYKASETYKALKPALTVSKKLYCQGAGENVKVLQKAKIFTTSVEEK